MRPRKLHKGTSFSDSTHRLPCTNSSTEPTAHTSHLRFVSCSRAAAPIFISIDCLSHRTSHFAFLHASWHHVNRARADGGLVSGQVQMNRPRERKKRKEKRKENKGAGRTYCRLLLRRTHPHLSSPSGGSCSQKEADFSFGGVANRKSRTTLFWPLARRGDGEARREKSRRERWTDGYQARVRGDAIPPRGKREVSGVANYAAIYT